MALDVKGIVDSGVDDEKSLGSTLRLEPPLLSLPMPDWQMRILRSTVFTETRGLVTIGTAKVIEECRPIRSQSIGEE